MRRAPLAPCTLLLWLLAALGCKDDGSKSTPPRDAGTGITPQGDADVTYMGPVQGGSIPVGAALEAGAGDDGPFEVSDACCDRTLAVEALGSEVSVRVVGNLAPLDGDGVAAAAREGVYAAEVCMPVNEAVRYRFEVELADDAGTTTVYRVDPTEPTVEDEDGSVWNVSAFTSCGDAGAGN